MKKGFTFIGLLTSFLLILSAFLPSAQAGFPEDWSSHADVKITNTSGALNDYQVLVTVNTTGLVSLGKMRSDGADIRFLDSDNLTPLPFWIEAPTMNTASTRIWVKVPTIPASQTKTIYMYYGNPSAVSLSDISGTFIFGDDFSGSAVDTSKWSVDTSHFTVSGGYLNGSNTNYRIQSSTLMSSPIIIETRTRNNSVATNGQSTLGLYLNSNDCIGLLEHAGGTPIQYWYRNNGSWVGPTSYNFAPWHKVKISIDTAGSGQLYIVNDNGDITTQSFSNTVLNEKMTLGMRYDDVYGGQTYNQDWDWVFARKYAATEPTTQVVFPITKIVFTTSARTTYQNYVSSVITVQTQDELGGVQNVAADTVINLSSSSTTGLFSSSALPFVPAGSVTIPSGANSASFYYKDLSSGTWVITADESPSQGWTAAQQNITVNDLQLGIYKTDVSVVNGGGALSDYQVLATINTAGLVSLGKMRSDGADIRFLDSDDLTPLSFWIETPTMNTANTRIWVKVPTIPASQTKTIYLYYGNPTASSLSSISDTFIFGDDFSGSAVDTSKWSVDTSRFTVSGGYLNGGNNNYYIQSATSMSSPIIIETRTHNNSVATNGQTVLGFYLNSNDCIGLLEHSGGSPIQYWYRNNGNWVGPYQYNFVPWHKAKISIDASGSGQLYVINDNGETTAQSFSNTVLNEKMTLGRRYDDGIYGQTYNQDWDWVFARKYAATEPTTQPVFPITKIVFTTSARTVYQNYISSVITIQTQDELGSPQNVTANTTINLVSTSSSGRFSAASSPFAPVSSVTIPAGGSSVSFYYKDPTVGTWNITAAESPSAGWTDAQQNITVNDLQLGIYKANITINNPAAVVLSDYQVLVPVNTAALVSTGKMNADGSDIRFLDSDDLTPLSFWIETPTMNTASTRIWVKVPTIPASSTKTIYLYYGSPTASSLSSISDTFIFGDDFSGSSVDTSKWSVDTSRFTVSGGYLNGGNTNYFIQSNTSMSSPIIIETRTHNNSVATNGQTVLGFYLNSNDCIGLLEHAGGAPIQYWYRNNSSWVGPYQYNFVPWHKAKISINASGSGQLDVINDNGETTAQSFSNTVLNEKMTLGKRYDDGIYGQTYNQDWDWVFARKYASTEPTTEVVLPIYKLAFITDPQGVFKDRISSVITVQTQDELGTPRNVTADVVVALSSNSGQGQFSANSSPFVVITSVTIPAGSNSVSFYYRDSVIGVWTLTAAESPSAGWVDAQQNITVREVSVTGKHRREVTINNSLALDLSNYQILITPVDTAALVSTGKMNADGSDIRFLDTDDLTPLSFWIETPTMNTASTRIWVKVPTIPASSTKTIYLYYGNPTASSLSSISDTFIFGDDFSGSSVDTSKWSVDTSRFTVSGGYLNGGNTNYFIQSNTSMSSPIIIETRTRNNSVATNGQTVLGFYLNSNDCIGLLEHAGGAPIQYWYRNNSSWVGPYQYNFVPWHKAKITIDGGGSGQLYVINDNGETTTQAFSNTVSNEKMTLGKRYDDGLYNQAYSQDWDWIFARKYAAIEPTNTVGAEESVISQLVFTSAPQPLVQNHSSNMMYIETQDAAGTTKTVSATTQINLVSDSMGGKFSQDGFSWGSDNTFTVSIPAGSSTVSFYYMDSQVGHPTITASEYPSRGWSPATQVEEVKSAVNTFRVEAATPLIAGALFTLKITAIDEDGNIATSYSDLTNIAVNYVSPGSGSGALSVTSTSAFVEGIATIVNQSYPDCGTVTITATKSGDISKTGTSSNIEFIPYDFSIQAEEALQTVNKEFPLTITARNAQVQACPNYKGTANLTVTYVSPSVSQGGVVTPSVLVADDFTNGVAAPANVKYDKWGTVKIKAADSHDAAYSGQSQILSFLPKDFSVALSAPPPSRGFYYKNEEFTATVTARDQNNNPVANYQGTMELSSSDRSMVITYNYLPADSGVHNFLLSFASSGNIVLTADDYAEQQVKGLSDAFEVKEAKIMIFSTAGPLGTVPVTVKIMDMQDNVITGDDSSTFMVTLDEPNNNHSASSDAKTVPARIQGGNATIYILDTEAEAVIVTPHSTPDLTPIAGTVNFGSFQGRGIGIDVWREVK